jgi:hypothetical protein
MDTYSDIPDTSYEIPMSEAEQVALRPALLRDLGAMPFGPDAKITRSLWVMFIGEWGVWTHAILPVDNRLDMPDAENIAWLCDLTGSLICPSLCHEGEQAMVVLRRPGPPGISEADAHIFRLVREAVAGQAATGAGTAAWTFHVVGPDGMQEVTGRTLAEAGHVQEHVKAAGAR